MNKSSEYVTCGESSKGVNPAMETSDHPAMFNMHVCFDLIYYEKENTKKTTAFFTKFNINDDRFWGVMHSPGGSKVFIYQDGDSGTSFMVDHIDGLVQERRKSNALAMELRLSCNNPSI